MSVLFHDSAPESVNIHRCLSCIQGNVGSVVGKGDNKVWNKKTLKHTKKNPLFIQQFENQLFKLLRMNYSTFGGSHIW